MSDEVRVSGTGAELPDAATSAVTGQTVPLQDGDSTQQPTDAAAQQPKLVPESQINELRSKLDKQIAQERAERQRIEQEYAQFRQQFETQQRQSQMSQRVQEYARYYAQQYPNLDQQSLYTAAQNAVEQEWQQYEQQQQSQQEYDQLRSFYQQEQQKQFLLNLRDEVVEATGLTSDELADATKHLDRTDPNFAAQVWRSAITAQQAKTQKASAQDLVANTPFPGRGGAAAGGSSYDVFTGQRGTEEHFKWIEQQERLRRGQQ